MRAGGGWLRARGRWLRAGGGPGAPRRELRVRGLRVHGLRLGVGGHGRAGFGRVADRRQALDQLPGHLPGRLDQHGAVQVAAPLTVQQVGALSVVSDATEHGGRGVGLAKHVLHLAERRAELLVVGDDDDTDPEVPPAPALRGRGEGDRAIAEPDHVGDVHLGHEHHRGRLGEQVVERAVGAEPPAVRDHVRLRHGRKRLADRAPEQAQPGALFRVGHPGQHVEAAVQLLHVFPDLLRLHAAPGDHGQAEHPAPRVEMAATHGREAVHEVPARRVALGQQDRTRPHSGERQCRCRDTWRSLVGRDSDQRHDHPDPGVSAIATSPAEA